VNVTAKLASSASDLTSELDQTVALVRAAAPHWRGPDEEHWASLLDAQHDRIQSALQTLLANDPDVGLELACGLTDYWHLRASWATGRDWLEKLLAAARHPSVKLRARALSAESGLAFRLGDNEAARRLGDEALAIARDLDDQVLTIEALTRLARVSLRDQNPSQTGLLSRQAIELAEKTGNEALSLMPLHCLAEATRMQGDLVRARELYQRSLDLNRKHGDQLVVAVETCNLAAVELSFGNLDAARRLWRDSLTLAHRMKNWYLFPYPVAGLGEVAAAEGQWDRAARLLGAANGRFKASGAAMDPADLQGYDHAVDAARRHLEAAAFDQAWGSGEAMQVDQIMAFA
jgi:tetratricopeptide (TPR) repeat protein